MKSGYQIIQEIYNWSAAKGVAELSKRLQSGNLEPDPFLAGYAAAHLDLLDFLKTLDKELESVL